MTSFFKMLFSKTKPGLENFIENLKFEYVETLANIENILREAKIYPQANYVEKTLENLKSENYEKFKKEIKSVNFWGGSGAVWEVYFEDKKLEKKFSVEMIKLIDLMEKSKISNSSIKPLKKLFEKEIRTSW